MTVTDLLPPGRLRLGAVVADGVDVGAAPDGLGAFVAAVGAARAGGLDAALDARRQAVRDALRGGAYRPTGRSKPAAEYLLRAAAEGTFPRINAVVDAANAVSLDAVLPVSLWDRDLAGTEAVVVRLGRPGEAYVFNGAGQTIELEDLACGVLVGPHGAETPTANPVKDRLATKTTAATRRVGALVYAPFAEPDALAAATEALAGWLGRCGPDARAAWAVVPPGGEVTL